MAALTANDVATIFETIAPRESGLAGDELGFIWGDPATEVRGAACLWNVHTRSLAMAVEQGLNLLVCHEALWLPPQRSPWYDGPGEADLHGNRLRRELLERHGLVVYRSHSNWDALPVDGVPDQAVAALGLGELEVIAAQRFFKVHRLPRAMTARELLVCAERGLGFGGGRLFGDPERLVERFAFLIGGFGENQLHMPQAARDLGAEAVILGEMSEFIVIACLEMDLPVIETLHSVSEIPAIRRQAALLQERLPDVPVRYVASGATAFAP
jgi:putative NIF3 family GTP cyclohydrolase 1 type 2